VHILSHLDPALPPVRLDEGRLKQILFNLLSNAVKFSPPSAVVAIHCRLVPRIDSPIGFDTVRNYETVNGVEARGGSLDGPGAVIGGGMVFVNSGYTVDGGAPGNVVLAFAPD
jgi:signal transduction histidine kinase